MSELIVLMCSSIFSISEHGTRAQSIQLDGGSEMPSCHHLHDRKMSSTNNYDKSTTVNICMVSDILQMLDFADIIEDFVIQKFNKPINSLKAPYAIFIQFFFWLL